MATMKENITNALSWFYDKLKKNDLEPMQEDISQLNSDISAKAPTSHASSATTYGVGTTSNYGHCMTINNLNTSSHTNGYALSAYQGYMLDSNKSNLLSTQNFSVDNITVPEGSSNSVTIDVSRSGYTPLGLVGWTFTNASSGGVNSSSVFLRGISGLSSTSWEVYLRNVYTIDAKINVLIRVLYVKN